MKTFRRLRWGFVAAISVAAFSQDLKKELDALDDLPEDDLNTLLEDQDGLDNLPAEKPVEIPKPPVQAETPLPVEEAPPVAEEVPSELEPVAEEPPSSPTQGDSLTGAAQEVTAKVSGIKFKQLPDRVRLTVHSDRPLEWKNDIRTNRKQNLISFRNAYLSKSILRRALDTAEFDGPVALIQAFDSKTDGPQSVKILFQLRRLLDPTILRSGNETYIDFPIPEDLRKTREGGVGADRSALAKTFMGIDAGTEFKGSKVTLSVKGAPLEDILNLVSKSAGKDFVLGPGVKSETPVTLNVKRMPWDQVLAIVLLNNGLGYQEINGAYRIVTLEALKSEISAASKAQEELSLSTPLETRLIPMSYQKAATISAKLKDFLSKRGTVTPDDRTNTIAITDLPYNIDKVVRYLKSVDRQTPQVLIEARIVEASEELTRDLSIDWKLGEVTSFQFGDSFMNVGKSAGGVGKGVGGTNADSGGAFLRMGNLGMLGTVQAVLGLAEKEKKAKVIASPRIVVTDGETANIEQSSSISQANLIQNGQVVQGFNQNFPLKLTVTPKVSVDGFVSLDVQLERTLPTAGSTSETRKANTKMLVESGKTGVIGGIYSIDKNEAKQGWPFLRKLPIIGFLFDNQNSSVVNRKELLMFVSPKILNAETLIGTTIPEDISNQQTQLEIDFSKLDDREGKGVLKF